LVRVLSPCRSATAEAVAGKGLRGQAGLLCQSVLGNPVVLFSNVSSHSVMLSGKRAREANSFGVEASLPKRNCPEIGIPSNARNDNARMDASSMRSHWASFLCVSLCPPWFHPFFLTTENTEDHRGSRRFAVLLLRLFHHDDPICRDILHLLDDSGGPMDLNHIY
jgi:hypothetical protein